jgi:hypothetical protein
MAGASLRTHHERPPPFRPPDIPSTLPHSIQKYVDVITAFDEAVADALATFNASMAAKFEAILDTAELETTEWVFATLRQERLEFQEQLMIKQRTFQTNMLNMLVTSQQNTIDCIMNNQATLQQTL